MASIFECGFNEKKKRTFLESLFNTGSYIWRGAQKGMMTWPW